MQDLSINNNQKREEWADIAKGILALFVVLGHCIQNINIPMSKGMKELYILIYSFHMPAFFILAGCFLNINKLQEKAGIFIWLKLKKLIFPCFGYCLFVLGYKLIIGMPIDLSFRGITKTLLFMRGGIFQNLWFFPALFVSYLILYILKSLLYHKKWVICLSILFLVGAFLFHNLGIKLPCHAELSTLAIPFVLWGYINKDRIRMRNHNIDKSIAVILLFVIGILLKVLWFSNIVNFYSLDYGNMITMFFFALLFSFICFRSAMMLERVPVMMKKMLEKIGFFSAEIYGFHWIFIAVCEVILESMEIGSTLVGNIAICLATILSVVLCLWTEKAIKIVFKNTGNIFALEKQSENGLKKKKDCCGYVVYSQNCPTNDNSVEPYFIYERNDQFRLSSTFVNKDKKVGRNYVMGKENILKVKAQNSEKIIWPRGGKTRVVILFLLLISLFFCYHTYKIFIEKRTINYNTNTFTGSVNKTFQMIQSKYPKAKIFVCTPLKCGGYPTEKNILGREYTFLTPNRIGKYESDYVERIIECSELFGIEVIDLYNTVPYDPTNPVQAAIYTHNNEDLLHPTDAGHYLIAQIMFKEMKDCLYPQSTKGAKAIFIGDSITHNIALHTEKVYYKYLSEWLELRDDGMSDNGIDTIDTINYPKNAGIAGSGYSTFAPNDKAIYSRLEEYNDDYDIIVIFTGINDFFCSKECKFGFIYE